MTADRPGDAPDTPPHIRRYRPEDLDALYEICLRTGDAGEDATSLTADARLLGDIYAAPYAILEPAHAFVLDDGTGSARGYVLAALDTDDFEVRREREWWPEVRARRPPGSGATEFDRFFVGMIHRPRAGLDQALADHPSHLHIDLLPEVQGRGWGRRLMQTAFESLQAAGSTGVHWGVNARNTRAMAFYDHIGCRRIQEGAAGTTFGMSLRER